MMERACPSTQRVLSSAQEMFYFNVTIDYHFNYTMSQSKSYTQIKDDISKRIMSDLDGVLVAIRVFRNMMFITAVLIVVKALIYRSKWMSNDRYDNIYITFTVKDLDERRKQNNKPGILPLNFDEEQKYIDSLSGHMIPRELRNLAFGLVLFITSMFNAAFYLLCDVGLYSALRLIEKNFGVISQPPVPAHTKMHVSGHGPMADMYKSVIGMFDPLSDTSKSKVDVAPCVPHPSQPDWSVYKLIACIYVVCLLLTITEAYGLRLRHVIMACYFQRRERARAIWLFNHILKTRGGILENARENMKKSKMGEVDTQHISLKGRLAANFPICEKILKCFGWEVKSCLYCGREGKPDDHFNFMHCQYYDCDAVYCIECYADLENVCAVCNNNVEIQGSGSSEELDSSLDEQNKKVKEAQTLRRQVKITELKANRRPSKMLARMRGEFTQPEQQNDESTGDNYAASDEESDYDDGEGNINTNADIDNAMHYELYRLPTNTDVTRRRTMIDNSRQPIKRALKDHIVQLPSTGTHARGSGTRHRGYSPSSDDDIVSETSVETSDLDFDYQDELRDTDDSSDDEPHTNQIFRDKRKPKLDLVTTDIFSDADDDFSEEPQPTHSNSRIQEPSVIRMKRK